MVIGYLHVICVSFFPAKTDPVLAVNPNCMLPFAVVLKGMQFVSRRNFKIVQPRGCIKHL